MLFFERELRLLKRSKNTYWKMVSEHRTERIITSKLRQASALVIKAGVLIIDTH